MLADGIGTPKNRAPAANQNASRRHTADAVDDELDVVHDDALYRNLLVNVDGCGFYGFAVMTWPRHVVITGDRGIFAFFRERRVQLVRLRRKINKPSHWDKKIHAYATGHGVKEFDHDVFVKTFHLHVADASLSDEARADGPALAEATLLDDDLYAAITNEDALDILHNEHRPHVSAFYHIWESDFTACRCRHLCCRHAIIGAIYRYAAATGRSA